MIVRELGHSGLVSFYNPDEDIGVEVRQGLVSVRIAGSSKLRDMNPERLDALRVLLKRASEELVR